MNEIERRRWIRDRQKNSTIWRIIHLLGSLALALLLLGTIAIACAIATIAESKYSTGTAREYIYKAPWFMVWLGVLCINLIAATLTRWPWQLKHRGFVITHAGIVVLLFGAVVGMKMGYEANITLSTKDTPANRLIINETILQVDSPKDQAIYTIPFPVQSHIPTEKKPRILPVPNSKLRIKVDRYEETLVEHSALEASPTGSPAVALQFHSNMMGQTVPVSLSLQNKMMAAHDFFGLAEIILQPNFNELLSSKDIEVKETQVVFANPNVLPVVHSPLGEPVKVPIRFLKKEDNTLTVDFGDGTEHPLSDVLKKRTEVKSLFFEVVDFWQDFDMKDGVPFSASDELKNPAILVHVTGTTTPPPSAKPKLVLVEKNDGIDYQVLRSGQKIKEGHAKTGESFATGWADWEVTVENALSQAVFKPKIEVANKLEMGEETPGLHVRLIDKNENEGEPVWIRSGRSESVSLNNEVVNIGFGLRTQRLPFTVQLQDFKVPRDEGTETPSNFISTIKFDDPVNNTSVNLVSRMNHPASYPGGFWRTATGLTYKFSQASWNPQDLNETTLQVLYDPGWLFKWTGSLMVVAGIILIFYIDPRGSRAHKSTVKKQKS